MLNLLIIPQGLIWRPVASQISLFELSRRLPAPQLKQAAKSSRQMAKCDIYSATKLVVFLCGGLFLVDQKKCDRTSCPNMHLRIKPYETPLELVQGVFWLMLAVTSLVHADDLS